MLEAGGKAHNEIASEVIQSQRMNFSKNFDPGIDAI
jgi:hypothetical protein